MPPRQDCVRRLCRPIIGTMEPSFFEQLFSSFMFWKLVGLAVIVGVVTFWYTYKTGRDPWDDLNAHRHQQDPAQREAGRE